MLGSGGKECDQFSLLAALGWNVHIGWILGQVCTCRLHVTDGHERNNLLQNPMRPAWCFMAKCLAVLS